MALDSARRVQTKLVHDWHSVNYSEARRVSKPSEHTATIMVIDPPRHPLLSATGHTEQTLTSSAVGTGQRRLVKSHDGANE